MGRTLFEDNLVHFDLPERLKWVTTTDPEFNKALDYILHTTYNLFINGPAGTGKSVMINLAYNMLKGTKMVLGSTGVSASCLSDAGVPACTIHRGLRVRPQEIFSRAFNPLDRNSVEACEILERVDIVIIEEVGMVSAALFDYIGTLIEEAELKRGKPIRILCFGDVLQLPPVVRNQPAVNKYYKNYYGKNFFFFNSEFFLRGRFVHLSLETIYRQSNTSFQNILNRLRLNRETDHDLEILNERVVSLTKFKKKHPFSMILAPTRNTVAFLNDKYGRPPEPVEEKAYYAVSDGNFDWDDAGLVEKEVKICVGQQVMCLYNESDQFQN